MRVIFVNGERRDYPEDISVHTLLLQLGLADKPLAVERNFELVARSRFRHCVLHAGDRVEIVHFIGGG